MNPQLQPPKPAQTLPAARDFGNPAAQEPSGHPLVDKHREQINDIRARTWKAMDRNFGFRMLEAKTREYAEIRYRHSPEAMQQINDHLTHIFKDVDSVEAVYSIPRKIAALQSRTPSLFTFLPGADTHRSISQYEIVLTDRFSWVTSRSQVQLSAALTPRLSISSPLLAANMRSVIGEELAEAMIQRGLIPVMHRFRRPTNPLDVDCEEPSRQSQEEADQEKLAWVERFGERAFFSSGTAPESVNFAKRLIERGALGICVDVALGNSAHAVAAVLELKEFIVQHGHSALIMAGNVDTDEGYLRLAFAGADIVKCGIGPGSPCTTRVVTRAGAGQGSALMGINAARFIYGENAPGIISDGGIESSADVLVAIALGAGAVMCGKLFARTRESAALKREFGGMLQAYYFGEASRPARLIEQGFIRPGTTVEGEGRWIATSGSVHDLLNTIEAGLRNALPYYDCTRLDQIQDRFSIPQQLCRLILGNTTGIYEQGGAHAQESGPRLQ